MPFCCHAQGGLELLHAHLGPVREVSCARGDLCARGIAESYQIGVQLGDVGAGHARRQGAVGGSRAVEEHDRCTTHLIEHLALAHHLAHRGNGRHRPLRLVHDAVAAGIAERGRHLGLRGQVLAGDRIERRRAGIVSDARLAGPIGGERIEIATDTPAATSTTITTMTHVALRRPDRTADTATASGGESGSSLVSKPACCCTSGGWISGRSPSIGIPTPALAQAMACLLGGRQVASRLVSIRGIHRDQLRGCLAIHRVRRRRDERSGNRRRAIPRRLERTGHPRPPRPQGLAFMPQVRAASFVKVRRQSGEADGLPS